MRVQKAWYENQRMRVIVLLIVIGVVAVFFSLPTHIEENSYAFVTEVTDGDTITIAGGARVRILGINAPERGEKWYKEPKKVLSEMILNQEILMEKDGADKDRYGRLLRHIWINDTLASEALARLGLVRAKYFNSVQKYTKEIANAEKEARNTRIGLWKRSEDTLNED